MFISLFIRILSIFFMIGFGVLARKKLWVDSSATTQMSKVVVNFFYPALIFSALIQSFHFNSLLENWALPVGTLIIMSIGFSFGYLVRRLLQFKDSREANQFLFQTTINNYSFLPLPIILMLWGERGVAQLIFSTLGSELSVWTLGIVALTGKKFGRESVKNFLSVPMAAILLAILVIFLRDNLPWGPALSGVGFLYELSSSFMSMLSLFGGATIPLSMFLVGTRMAVLKPEHLFTFKQAIVIFLRLLIIPAAALLIIFRLPFASDVRLILLVVAVMPSAMASVVIGEVYNSDTEFAASCILTTHVVSVLTIPIWLSLFI